MSPTANKANARSKMENLESKAKHDEGDSLRPVQLISTIRRIDDSVKS
ncbi:hypothetical protein G9P44_003663 [Scheffersomyces stipitis]|nr:hypothetical protein G9P44_003663 [Scheffersomyces stipitis]